MFFLKLQLIICIQFTLICYLNGKYLESSSKTCDYCKSQFPDIINSIKMGKIDESLQIIVKICLKVTTFSTSSCKKLIDTYKFSIINVAQNTQLNSTEVCYYLWQCKFKESKFMLWDVQLPKKSKPPTKLLEKPKPGSKKLRILQLSDIHIDHKYAPGSIIHCQEKMCCNNVSVPIKSNQSQPKAGYWGGGSFCDVPLWTVENMFEFISKNEKFDFIYWLGDIAPHDVENQSKQTQIEAIRKLSSLYKKYFPNITVYSTLGNHEAYPSNLFPTPIFKKDNINWLYNEAAKDWIANGLPRNIKYSLNKGGFYTTLIVPGLRLVSLNMNYCYNFNFWLYLNSTDPVNQLDWLVKILQYSEDHGEKVHIIGHEYPSTCLLTFGKNYYKIVNRYENTITGQFFGHEHADYFETFYEIDNFGKPTKRPTNVAFVAPSVTTFMRELPYNTYFNPAYRIYTIDGLYKKSTFGVLSHHTKILDLKRANELNDTTWLTEYDTKTDYGLETLFPTDLAAFADRMLSNVNASLSEKFLKYYYKSGVKDLSICDNKCRLRILCRVKQARSDNFVPCL